jgi:hypothetical protein
MANEVQRVRQAIVALVTSDATLQALCGRSTDLVRGPAQLSDAPLPMLVFGDPVWDSRSRQMTVPLGAVAEDATAAGANETTQALLVQLEVVLSALGFNAQGVDAVPLAFDRSLGEIDPEGSPTLTIAEATATLLVFA